MVLRTGVTRQVAEALATAWMATLFATTSGELAPAAATTARGADGQPQRRGAVRWLDRLVPDCCWTAGHSEGTLHAAGLAADELTVAGAILLSGARPHRRGDRQMADRRHRRRDPPSRTAAHAHQPPGLRPDPVHTSGSRCSRRPRQRSPGSAASGSTPGGGASSSPMTRRGTTPASRHRCWPLPGVTDTQGGPPRMSRPSDAWSTGRSTATCPPASATSSAPTRTGRGHSATAVPSASQ